MTVLFVICGIVFYAMAILGLWLAWDALSWGIFYGLLGGFVVFLPLILLIVLLSTLQSAAPFSHPLLGEILAAKDDRLMPPVVLQPLPSQMSVATEAFGPFDSSPLRPKRLVRQIRVLSVAMLPMLLIIFISAMLIFVLPSFQLLLSIILITLATLLIPMIVVVIVWAVRQSAGQLQVTTDSNGITWRDGAQGPAQQMAWSQARALLRVATTSSSSSTTSTITNYVLLGTDATLVWSDQAWPRKKNGLAGTEQLLSVIVAHTSLPLREATQFANMLAGAGKDTQRLLDHYGLTKRLTPDLMQDLHASTMPPSRRWGILVSIAAVLWISVPLGAGIWGQSYNATYFASVPQRVAAEQPLYSSTLAYDDGRWPVVPNSTTFTNGVYEMHNPANTSQQVALLSDARFGDAAYQVTVTESGAVPDGAYDGIGLALHANANASSYIAFYVKYDGEWELDDNSPTQLYGGFVTSDFSSAIHQGPGATNQLLVIIHNQSAYFYVNNQFVATYGPESFDTVDLSQTGAAGVYLNSAAMTGDFTDFRVAPDPPIDFWEMIENAPPWQG
jgi:hypothetical protein